MLNIEIVFLGIVGKARRSSDQAPLEDVMGFHFHTIYL